MTEWIVTSSVLIAAVTALRYLLRGRISLRLQYALWAVVLLRLLLPVQLGQTSFSVLNAVEESTELQLTVSRPLFYLGETPDLAMPVVTPDPALSEEEFTRLQQKLELQYYEDMAQYATPVSPSTVLRALWIAGIAVTGTWFLATNLRFAAALRRSRRETGLVCGKLTVYVSPLVDTPCLFGLVRPAVYVTESALRDDTVLRHILAHEETHYRHGDHLWAVLRGVCLALHWYNPLVWLAAALSRRDAELACDEGALHRLGEEQRTAYGETLIALTCGHQKGELLLTATTMTGSKKSLRERITLIAKRPKMALYALTAALLVVCVAAGCTFTGGKKHAVPEELAFSYVSSEHVDAQVLSAVRTYIIAHVAILNELAGDDEYITECSIHSIAALPSDGSESAPGLYDVSYQLLCEDPAAVIRLSEISESREFAEKWQAEGTNGEAPVLDNAIHTIFRAQVLGPHTPGTQVIAEKGTLAHLPSAQRLDAALERLRDLQPEELETALVDSRFSAYTSAELAAHIQSAADRLPDRAGSEGSFYWQLSVHLPATPKKGEGQERIAIRASVNEESLLEVTYRSKDQVTLSFLAEDSELYWFIRGAYRTENVIDEAAMAPYRDLLEAELQVELVRSAGWPQPASGYEILSFQQVDSFHQDGADYTVYHWDAAFLSEDPMMAGMAGGMWLDDQLRIRGYVRNTELCIRTVNGETDYGLWGVYDDWAPIDGQRETGRKSIVNLFAQKDQQGVSFHPSASATLPGEAAQKAATDYVTAHLRALDNPVDKGAQILSLTPLRLPHDSASDPLLYLLHYRIITYDEADLAQRSTSHAFRQTWTSLAPGQDTPTALSAYSASSKTSALWFSAVISAPAEAARQAPFSIHVANGHLDYPEAAAATAAQYIQERTALLAEKTGDALFISDAEVTLLEPVDIGGYVTESFSIGFFRLDYRLQPRVPSEVNMQLDGMVYSTEDGGLWLKEDQELVLLMVRRQDLSSGSIRTQTQVFPTREVLDTYGSYADAAAAIYNTLRSSGA